MAARAHHRAPRNPAARHLRLLRRRSPTEPAEPNLRPDCLVLEPEPTVPRSSHASVRIFLGTQPAQQRAERVFVWSILRHRDPGRRYEIYLMTDLARFDRHLASVFAPGNAAAA